MSVPEQVPYKEYRATGSNNSFEITFYLPDPKDLVVMVNKEIPLVGAYSIQGNTVVFNTPPNEGDLVELTRDTQLDRETNFKSYDNSFRPETINFDLDKIWLVLQESNLVDAKILARLKQEIEWRRTHDFNYDELAQVREKQLFDALKGYTDTLLASTNPGVFQGVIAGVVFARDGKSIQTHIEEILNNLELNRSYIDEQVGLMAPQATTYNKVEVDTKINAEATRAQVAEQVLQDQVNAVGVGNKAYLTYAEMDADKANNPINSKLEVTNDPDPAKNGTYQWNGATLTKSAYDPLTQAKNYTVQEINQRIENFNIQLENQSEKIIQESKAFTTDSVGLAVDLLSSNLSYLKSYNVSGSYSMESVSRIKLNTAKATTDPVHRFLSVLKVNDTEIKLGRADEVTDGLLKTYYLSKTLITSEIVIATVLRSNNVSFYFGTTADFPSLAVSAIETVGAYDEDRVIQSCTQVEADSIDVESIFLHSTRLCVALAIPRARIENDGVNVDSTSELVSWLRAKYPTLKVRYRINTALTQSNPIDLVTDKFTLSFDADIANVSLDAFGKKDETSKTDITSVNQVLPPAQEVFATSVKNASGQNLSDGLIALKVNFPQSLIFSDDQILVQDNSMNSFVCQFCADEHVNLRKQQSEGFWTDGSFKSGTLYIKDSIDSGETKRYRITAYAKKIRTSENPLQIVTGLKTDTFNMFGLSFTFANISETNGTLLSQIKKGSTLLNIVSQHRYSLNVAGVITPINFTKIKSRNITAKGSIFVDVTFDLENTVQEAYGIASGDYFARVTYRIFSDGLIKIRSVNGVNVDTTYAKLMGIYHQFNVSGFNDSAFISNATYQHGRFTHESHTFDVLLQCAIGDLHREGPTYGPTRSALNTLNMTATSVTSVAGWRNALNSTDTWNIEAGYVWFNEINIIVDSTIADSKTLCEKLFNIPTGFAGTLETSSAKKLKLKNMVYDLASAQTDYLYSKDGQAAIGVLQPHSSMNVFDAQLMLLLTTNEGDFDSIFNNFILMLRTRFGNDLSQIGTKYTSGSLMLQFESRYTATTMSWLYHEALKRSDTLKIDTLKTIAQSLCDAFKMYVANYPNAQGIALSGNITVANTNSNGSAMRFIALAIKMGLDTDGSLLAMFNSIESKLIDPTVFMPLRNFWTEGAGQSVVVDRYLHYIAYALNGYVQACILLNRAPAFDVTQFLLNGFNANGDPRDHEWCRSESRRGIRGTNGFALIPMLYGNHEGSLNGALKMCESLARNGYDSEAKPKRCLDFYYVLSTQSSENVGTEVPFNIHALCDVWFNLHYKLT